MNKKACEYCGAEFQQNSGRGRARKYCSPVCRKAQKRAKYVYHYDPEKARAYYHAHKKEIASSKIARRKRRLAEAERVLGGRCVDCGSTTNLEFAHLKPGPRISLILLRNWDYVLGELKKCQLRCRPCHRKRHFPNG